jgi:hypothetical protein
MPDNWGFVTAAYAVAALVFGGYWRHLARRERELAALNAGLRTARARGSAHRPPAPPRREPASRHPRP